MGDSQFDSIGNEVVLGLPMLEKTWEAPTAYRLVKHILTSGDLARQRAEWSCRSILKTTIFRTYMGQRPPLCDVRSDDRSQRLTEILEILVEMGVFVPLSVKETIEELGEPARNKGSYVRVVNIDRLMRAAGIELPQPPSDGVQPIVREAPRAYDVFMAEQRVMF